MRETGYYWVKDSFGYWDAAKYDSETKEWVVVGSNGNYTDDQFFEIDEKQIIKT